EVPQDYVFEGEAGKVKLSQLFGRGSTLLAYSFMYGPKMEKACPSCTSILDALEGTAPHVAQRTSFVVIARSPLERILEHARRRGWSHLRLLSSEGNTYNRDYHAETAEGAQMPMLNVFRNAGGAIRHFWGSELLHARTEEGQHPRHVDMAWPLWNLLDLTPEGRGVDWHPKLEY
ncbi:MAG: DUF899 family protein, partial [Myxococcota bacterium]